LTGDQAELSHLHCNVVWTKAGQGQNELGARDALVPDFEVELLCPVRAGGVHAWWLS